MPSLERNVASTANAEMRIYLATGRDGLLNEKHTQTFYFLVFSCCIV